jgi:hypothetical protein
MVMAVPAAAMPKGALAAHPAEDTAGAAVADAVLARRVDDDDDVPLKEAVAAVLVSPCSYSGQPAALVVASPASPL